MQSIHSSTTADRLLRTTAFAVLLSGAAVYLLVDGFISYDKENVTRVFNDVLGATMPVPEPVSNENLTSESVRSVAHGQNRKQAEMTLGPHAVERDSTRYYFGKGGYVTLTLEGDSVKECVWNDGPAHTATDIWLQRVLGFVLSPIALYAIFQLFVVLTTRASLTDDGLRIGRRPVIPLAHIRSISMGGHSEVVTVAYEHGGQEATVDLDSYKIKEQPAIVTALCNATNLPHPFENEKNTGS